MRVFKAAPDDLRCLVLNADYQPLSYYPLSTWPWQEAIKAAFLERVDIVSEYNTEIRSPSRSIRAPWPTRVDALTESASHRTRTIFRPVSAVANDDAAVHEVQHILMLIGDLGAPFVFRDLLEVLI